MERYDRITGVNFLAKIVKGYRQMTIVFKMEIVIISPMKKVVITIMEIVKKE